MMLPVLIIGGAGLLLLAMRRRAQAPSIVDLRARATLTDDAQKHTRTRPASDVDALVLHQMGFDRGNDPSKYLRVTAHYVILPDGGTYQLHDHTARLPAATKLNGRSVSVEFAGNLPSKPRSTNPAAFWNPSKAGMDQLTDAQIAAGRRLVDHLVRTGVIRNIFAHRQGGPKRENDPGPDIWREIGAYGVQRHKLGWGGPGWVVGNGKPIPSFWWGSPNVA